MQQLFEVEKQGWRQEVSSIREHFARFGEHLPHELAHELLELEQRLEAEPAQGGPGRTAMAG